jgi:hypothetical protein
MTPTAPHKHPNVPISGERPDLEHGDKRCPVRERDGQRCSAPAGMWSYGHICDRHAEQLRRGRKLVLVNGARLDRPWAMPGRFGWYERLHGGVPVSGATYRIDTEWDAHVGVWFSRITRLSDDQIMDSVFGNIKSECQQRAREWVMRETRSHDDRTSVYVGDDGQDAEAPHSVKA